MNYIDNTELINYLYLNQDIFIQVIDKIYLNSNIIPVNLNFFAFYNNFKIDSLISWNNYGYFYIKIKNEYITQTIDFLYDKSNNIYSIYGENNIINKIIDKLIISPKYINEYYIMQLEKKNYIDKKFLFPDDLVNNYKTIKCNEKYFDKLKKLQYNYHKEEVYTFGTYYPYKQEMQIFKNLLKERIVYGVFNKNNIAIAKANTNAETKDSYQLGGIYTLKNYRNKKIATLCLVNLLNELFTTKDNIYLYVKKNNFNAIKLYEKFGFKIINESILYYF